MANVYKGYVTSKGTKCYKLPCFLPFSGNGTKICRFYELGKCKEKFEQMKKKP